MAAAARTVQGVGRNERATCTACMAVCMQQVPGGHVCQDPDMHVPHSQIALPGTSVGGRGTARPCQEQWVGVLGGAARPKPLNNVVEHLSWLRCSLGLRRCGRTSGPSS